MPLQIRRGNTAEINSITPLIGELVYDTQLKRVVVGDGSTAGGTPFGGVSANEAKDAAASILLDGSHQNISFSYDSTLKILSAKVDILSHDTIETDSLITSKIFNTSSSVVLDVDLGILTADVNGNLTGNVNGIVTGTAGSSIVGTLVGDVTGSVFADDSSRLVDAIDKAFYGTMVTDNIRSEGSVIIGVESPVNFQQSLTIDQVSNFYEELVVFTESTSQRLISLTQVHNTNASSSALNLRRARGTLGSQSVVSPEDNLGNILFTGFDGSVFTESSVIRGLADRPVSVGKVPGRLEFLTVSDFTDTLTRKMYIGSRNEVRVEGDFQVYSGVYDATAFAWFQQSHEVPDARNIGFYRTRGTLESPVIVQNGDDIVDFQFGASDGALPISFTAAAMTVKVDTAPSAGDVRAGFEFATYNGTALANRVTISSAGLLSALGNLATPNISPVATDSDLALDPAAKGTGTVNFKVPELVAGVGSGQVDVSIIATFIKVKINGNEYAIPAYDINP